MLMMQCPCRGEETAPLPHEDLPDAHLAAPPCCPPLLLKVSEKCSVATDLLYNWNTREAAQSVGYDYMFRSSRVRGGGGGGALFLPSQRAATVCSTHHG